MFLSKKNNEIHYSHNQAWSPSTANSIKSDAQSVTGIQKEKENSLERIRNGKPERKRALSCCACMLNLPQNFGLVSSLHSANSPSANNGHLCFHRDRSLWAGAWLRLLRAAHIHPERLIKVLKSFIQHGGSVQIGRTYGADRVRWFT